jgi:hypothetical protein
MIVVTYIIYLHYVNYLQIRNEILIFQDKERLLKISENMNVTLLARDLRQTDTRILLQSFLSQWIPLSVSVLG